MKLKIKVGELVEQLIQAAITIDPKSADQPNSKVYLRAAKSGDTHVLYYYSTNSTARTFIKSMDVEVLEPGELLVEPARMLGGLQNRDPGLMAQIEVKTADDTSKKILVTIGKNRFQLQYAEGAERMASEIERLPCKAEPFATIPAQLLADFIKRTSFCIPAASNGQQRFAMDVMHLKAKASTYIAQATDGGIVSLNSGPKSEQLSFTIDSLLIPLDALNPLQKIINRYKDTNVELVNGEAGESKVRELFFRMKGVTLSVGKSARASNMSATM